MCAVSVKIRCTIATQFCDVELVWHLWSSGQEEADGGSYTDGGALHTAHCTLHTAHCTLHIAHCTLHTAHCSLHHTFNLFCRLDFCAHHKPRIRDMTHQCITLDTEKHVVWKLYKTDSVYLVYSWLVIDIRHHIRGCEPTYQATLIFFSLPNQKSWNMNLIWCILIH